MSGILLAALTNAPAIISFVEQLMTLGTDAATLVGTITPMIQNDSAPTHAQWVAAGLSADAADAKINAL